MSNFIFEVLKGAQTENLPVVRIVRILQRLFVNGNIFTHTGLNGALTPFYDIKLCLLNLRNRRINIITGGNYNSFGIVQASIVNSLELVLVRDVVTNRNGVDNTINLYSKAHIRPAVLREDLRTITMRRIELLG